MTAAITLEADRARDPYLVRAYRGGRLVAYTVHDAFGWAIVARVDRAMATVDRYELLFPDEPASALRAAAIQGLTRLAATGSIGDT